MAFPRQRINLPRTSWLTAFTYLIKGTLIDGPEIEEFESKFAEFIGAKFAITVPSGRAGLKSILDGLQYEPGEEILVPAYTYPIVPFVVKSMGYRLKFVDIEIPSLSIDPVKLEKAISKNTKAVIATHLFGVPCKIEEIIQIAKAKDVDVIEDCAHACGASVDNVKTGNFGRCSYFSFETSKCINTLGGGIITTSDPNVASRIRANRSELNKAATSKIFKRLLKNNFEAIVTHPTIFSIFIYPMLKMAVRWKNTIDVIGSAYVGADITMSGRMEMFTNYQARLGLQQLNNITQINEKRTHNAQSLVKALQTHILCHKPVSLNHHPNYLLFTILIRDMAKTAVDLLKVGIDTKRHYMSNCSAIYDTGENFPNAVRADHEAIHLPSYPELSQSEIEKIASCVNIALKEDS